MFAWPAPDCTTTCRLAPFLRECFALVDTWNFGLNGRFLQPATANGVETATLDPGAPVEGITPEIVPVTCSCEQLVGLKMNPSRSIVTLSVFRRNGTPSRLCCNGPAVTVTCAVCGLSLIHISEPTRLGMISYAVFC